MRTSADNSAESSLIGASSRHRLLHQTHPVRRAVTEDRVVEPVGGMVALLAVAHTKENKGAGALQQHEGEVLAAHQRRGSIVDAVSSDHIARYLRGYVRLARVVDGGWVYPRILRLCRPTVGARDPISDFRDPPLHQIAYLGIEGADGPGDRGACGNDVEGGARVESARGNHGRLHRVDVARDDRL